LEIAASDLPEPRESLGFSQLPFPGPHLSPSAGLDPSCRHLWLNFCQILLEINDPPVFIWVLAWMNVSAT